MILNKICDKILFELTPFYGDREAKNIIKTLCLDLPLLDGKQKSDHLSNSEVQELNQLVIELKSYKPVQYITGVAHFYGYKFRVNPSVLIPRPETEELVYYCLRENTLRFPKILDIGTGSGCIPISIKKNLADAHITAIDISEVALTLAQENAKSLNVDIDFKHLDFLDKSAREGLGQYDIILSNPPYIDSSEKERMGVSVVRHEPHVALFTASDALVFYKKIASFLESHLNETGFCLMELNEFRAEETSKIFKKWKTEIIYDLQNKPRILKVQR